MGSGRLSAILSKRKRLKARTPDEIEADRTYHREWHANYRKIHDHGRKKPLAACTTLKNRNNKQTSDPNHLTSDFILKQAAILNDKLNKFPVKENYFKQR